MTAEVVEELPDLPQAEGGCMDMEDPVTGEKLLYGDTTFPDGLDSLASSTPVTGDFWEHGPEGDSPQERLATAMMGDTDPFWGVMASPSPTPWGSWDTGDKDLQVPLPSPLPSPPPAPQPRLPSTAQLMEELQRRQLRVLLTRLPLPPGTVTCRGLPGPGAAGARNTKRPAPVRDPEGHRTAPLDTIPRKRRTL
ncbi:embryonal Fyn-associated substrate-like [Columba livia]|uniref:embryonal Fyn-associated substrate-like n=1 Tax=Columba livia TaxID=8932 RepID=UPI0031BA66E8